MGLIIMLLAFLQKRAALAVIKKLAAIDQIVIDRA
jgi:hypothetical protein